VYYHCYSRLKAYIVFTFLDSFRNTSGKPQPIRTKVGTHAQAKEPTTFTKLWAQSVKWGRNGGLKSVLDAGFFCQQYEMTFWQLRNGRFSPHLAMTSESWAKRRLWTEIYEKFPFRCHLPPKPQTLRGSNRHLTQSRPRDALQRDTV